MEGVREKICFKDSPQSKYNISKYIIACLSFIFYDERLITA